MSHPRLLRTRKPRSLATSARKPSHFTSNDHAPRLGIGPDFASIGSGTGAAVATASEHKAILLNVKRYCPVHGIVDPTHTRRCRSRWKNGSTAAWRKTRAAVLARDGYTCTEPNCGQPATEVHHVTDTTLRSVCPAHNPRGG